MRRRSFLVTLPALAVLALAGCSSSTDIQDIDATGQWDALGAIQVAHPGLKMVLSQGENGTVSGEWWFPGQTRRNVSGTNTAGDLELTLFGFPVGTVRFEGRFTNDFRMEGVLEGSNADGPAVFRRTSFNGP